jgi:tetratricopeptide (TPR) repeat protein
VRDLNELAQCAEQAMGQGRYQEALTIIQQVLAHESLSLPCLNMAGVCAIQLGRNEEAVAYWLRVLEGQASLALPRVRAEAAVNLGVYYAKQGEYTKSIAYCRLAIEYCPDDDRAYLTLGNALYHQQQIKEAEEAYGEAIRCRPDHSEAYLNRANSRWKRGCYVEAQSDYEQALLCDAQSLDALLHLGVLSARQKRYPLALQYYQRALALDSHSVEAMTNVALLMEAMGHPHEAETCFRRALTLSPMRAEIHSNLGNLLMHQWREAEAEACYREALMLAPQSATHWCNLGALLANIDRDREAEEAFREALRLQPEHGLSALNLGYLLLSQGRWTSEGDQAGGWVYHESRYVPDSADGETHFPTIPFPKWRGESLKGKSILVWLEQGFGDCIQFSRYVLALKEEGAQRIMLRCRPELNALLQTLGGGDDPVIQICSEAQWHNEFRYDYWTFLLSIPRFLQTSLASIPATIPYLFADPERIQRWSLPALQGHQKRRIGLVWKGFAYHSNDAHRSLAALEALASLWSISDVQWVSLQKGQGEEEAQHRAAMYPDSFIHVGSDVQDFAESAAVIHQLDGVIGVDTSTMHLAAAMGKPCWMLLPAYKTDWRWLKKRHDSPWYPGVMRLLRQSTRGEWGSVMEELKNMLESLR